MKFLQLSILIGIFALLSGCACECDDDSPLLQIELRNFSPQELSTVYVVTEGGQNACFTCIDAQGRGVLNVGPNSRYEIKSDSIPLDKIIQVKEIRTETSEQFACECTSISGIDYELDGINYTNEPIVITR